MVRVFEAVILSLQLYMEHSNSHPNSIVPLVIISAYFPNTSNLYQLVLPCDSSRNGHQDGIRCTKDLLEEIL